MRLKTFVYIKKEKKFCFHAFSHNTLASFHFQIFFCRFSSSDVELIEFEPKLSSMLLCCIFVCLIFAKRERRGDGSDDFHYLHNAPTSIFQLPNTNTQFAMFICPSPCQRAKYLHIFDFSLSLFALEFHA